MAEVTTTETVTPEITPKPTPTNSEDKKSPAFLAITAKLAEYERKDAERKAAEKQAAREAEDKRLKDAGLFDELAAKHQAELSRIAAEHMAEIRDRDIKTELLKVGFRNDIFVAGAVKGYDVETHGEISAYVAALAADESNKGLLESAASKIVHKAAGAVPSGGPDATLKGDRLRAAAASENKELRLQAIAIKQAFYDKNGTFDGLYD